MFMYFRLKMVVRPKQVADKVIKIVKRNYWKSVALDGKHWNWWKNLVVKKKGRN
jgi:hypothetical protein